MNGSLRQRGTNSWELRVYAGTDADTGHDPWASMGNPDPWNGEQDFRRWR